MITLDKAINAPFESNFLHVRNLDAEEQELEYDEDEDEENGTPDISDYPLLVQEFISGLIPMNSEDFEECSDDFPHYPTYYDYLSSGNPLFDAFGVVVSRAAHSGKWEHSFRKLVPLYKAGHIDDFVDWLFIPECDLCPIDEGDRQSYAAALLCRLSSLVDWRKI